MLSITLFSDFQPPTSLVKMQKALRWRKGGNTGNTQIHNTSGPSCRLDSRSCPAAITGFSVGLYTWKFICCVFSLWLVLHTLFIHAITEYAIFFYCYFPHALNPPKASHSEFHLPNLDSTVRLFETVMTGYLILTHCLPVFTFISPQHLEIWILSWPHYSNHSYQGNCCPPSFVTLRPAQKDGVWFWWPHLWKCFCSFLNPW